MSPSIGTWAADVSGYETVSVVLALASVVHRKQRKSLTPSLNTSAITNA